MPLPTVEDDKSKSPEQNKIVKQRQPTVFSNQVGAFTAAIVEQLAFSPFDTWAKNAMKGKAASKAFVSEVFGLSGFAKINRVYAGLGIGLIKKVPARTYKYAMQNSMNGFLREQYLEKLTERFGVKKAKLIITTMAGAMTGVLEPLLFQPIDTMQVNKQVSNEPLSFATAKKLGLTGLYRGSVITAFGRNLPGCVGLFSGSQYANDLMGNEDKKDEMKNVAAKLVGGELSVLLAQPGDVLKTEMQTGQVPLTTAFKKFTIENMLTNGLKQRMVVGAKVGAGFFIAEKCMDLSTSLLGHKPENHEMDALADDFHKKASISNRS